MTYSAYVKVGQKVNSQPGVIRNYAILFCCDSLIFLERYWRFPFYIYK